jgi:hypothetical protein
LARSRFLETALLTDEDLLLTVLEEEALAFRAELQARSTASPSGTGRF